MHEMDGARPGMDGARVGARTLALAVSGPAALGAAIGARFGIAALATRAALTPAIVVGVTALMVPALYIAASLVGEAPPMGRFGAAAAAGLRAAGIAMLGLTGPALFLIGTARGTAAVWLVGGGALFAGVLVGLRALYRALFGEGLAPNLRLVVFGSWSAVAMAIGARLLVGAP